MPSFDKITSGLTGLDVLLQSIRLGDNVVWQVDKLSDYLHFVKPFVKESLKKNSRIIYIRFAKHKQLLEKQKGLKIYDLSSHKTFESFTTTLHKIISKEGKEVFYVFDCLSDLHHIWATDLMIGNFFMVTCPYLYELDTVAYFAIYRKKHAAKTIARIRETTQLLLDVYSIKDSLYLHPLKVSNRYSPSMFLPHLAKGNNFTPIINSAESARVLSHIYRQGLDSAGTKIDFWDKLYLEAKKLSLNKGKEPEKKKMFIRLSELILGRETKMLKLIYQHFSLTDLVEIMERLIGSGYVGGKTIGMLLARKILSNELGDAWHNIMEEHDSFYIGSDVFYTYLIQNGWWKLWLNHKKFNRYDEIAKTLQEKMLKGRFPEEIREKFQEIIEYFGQSPIIIRSSSLLEDSFGNAFAGKYESVFIVNQNDPEERLKNFEESVRLIFASTMNENALAYREQRGLSDKEEQMALLVQRVSGSHKQKYFFPDLAGVGISYNIFLWKKELDRQAGMLRLVLGLGTRAVDRVENDYPRIVALDQPLLKAHASKEDTRKYSQHQVDVLHKKKNILTEIGLDQLLAEKIELPLEQIAEKDQEAITFANNNGQTNKDYWLLTFDNFLANTTFAQIMQEILKTLKKNYQCPVDIEFTANFIDSSTFKINLLQCRPFQTNTLGKKIILPENITDQKLFFRSLGFFLGGNIEQKITQVIFIESSAYSELTQSDKYQVARIIGTLNKMPDTKTTKTMLIGPGRWGSSTPSLGVPVNFAEINNFKTIIETTYPIGQLMPELSMGSHFFQDLIETNIYYAALYLEKETVFFNRDWLDQQTNKLAELLPEYAKYSQTIKVIDINLTLLSDILTQKIICLFANNN